jgi:Arc/MetJ-type ribon-helix-helix transcriptional regulator
MKTVTLRLRAEAEFKQLLQNAVKEGRAENMSELIRKAIFNFLSVGLDKPKPDLRKGKHD